MTPRLVALILVVALTTAVGASAAPGAAPVGSSSTPSPTTNASHTAGLGTNISMFLAASEAQTKATVENGMWAAAIATVSNTSTKRALVKHRIGDLNTTVAELREERQALRSAFLNGTINRTTYRARMASLVGRLTAFGESLETVNEQGRAVGINTTRLQTIRSAASDLGGGEVSAIARNLTGGHAPSRQGDIFDDRPGRSDERGQGPGDASNRSNRSTSIGPPDDAGGNRSADPSDDQRENGNASDRSNRSTSTGPPDDRGREGDNNRGANSDDQADNDRDGDQGADPGDDRGNGQSGEDRSNRLTSTGPPDDGDDGRDNGSPSDRGDGRSDDEPTTTESDGSS